ncbi:O-antigen ligase family protein [Alteromonas lipolytica]|uniref:O-antigen ligase-related domain-containing protein n=1 Tax=Alteromonas lipolytica TaxID=1856405 RepID=A0A1E8FFQ7_9ALTE|nr:O-antigen ligase family protein [Alteromonas lipolytica]OFI34772.1 hypothetical protein BFC17_14425 [Alteromonas lipolytica]GGF53879.1 polymerase [Alteromonas lipolytica]
MLSRFKHIKPVNAPLWFLFLLLIYLALLQLPLGGHIDWARNLGQLSLFAITLAYGLMYWPHLQQTISIHRIPLTLFFLVIIWIAFQWVPLPIDLVAVLSPESAKAYNNAGLSFASISLDKPATFEALLKAGSYFCIFVLGLALFQNEKTLLIALLFMVIAGTYNAFYGAFEILSGQDLSLIHQVENGHRASGTFVYHNHFANFLILCLSAGLGYFIATLSHRRFSSKGAYAKALLFSILEPKSTVRLCLTIMVIALVMSHSRMGNTAFFVSLCSVSVLYMLFGKQVPKTFKVLVISMLIIDIFVVSAWFGLEEVAERLESTSMEVENRDEVVEDGLKMLEKFPLTGSGAGSFEYAWTTYLSENIRGRYTQAHNDYLQFAIEYGIPVLMILGLFIIHVLFTTSKVLFNTENKYIAGAAAASLMATLGMLMHMSVDLPLVLPAISSYFVLLLAIGYSAFAIEKNKLIQAH